MIFRVSHLRRGGGHVVSMWILDHFDNVTYSNSTNVTIKANIVRGDGSNFVVAYEDKLVPADCYILRDAYNNIASRLKINDKGPNRKASHGFHENSVDLWLAFASQHVTFTLYNAFVNDEEYRLHEARRLNLPNHTRNPSIEKVHGYGGGSSFDGVRGTRSTMDVENRWKHYVTDQRFTSLIQRDDVRELNHKLFGWCLNKKGEYTS